jgi:hypothetical protein
MIEIGIGDEPARVADLVLPEEDHGVVLVELAQALLDGRVLPVAELDGLGHHQFLVDDHVEELALALQAGHVQGCPFSSRGSWSSFRRARRCS